MTLRSLASVVIMAMTMLALTMADATTTVNEDVCTGVPRHTLLASCPSCSNGAACIAYDRDPNAIILTGCDFATGSTDAYCETAGGLAKTCEFQCFTKLRDSSVFSFIVPYKATLPVSTPRQPAPSNSVTTTTDNIPFQSNVFVNAIGKLDVPSTVTTISIYGGRQELATKGRVITMTVDKTAFEAAPQLKSVALVNMDLSNNLSTALASLPTTLTSLDLRNTRLSSLPDGLVNKFEQLQTLSLSANTLSSVNMTLPNLNSLDLSANKLTSFTVTAPQLHSLDLSDNALVAIPQSVFLMRNLRVLDLAKNPIVEPLQLTPPQVEFLKQLQEVTIDTVPAATTTSPVNSSSPNTPRGISTITIGTGITITVDTRGIDTTPTPTSSARNSSVEDRDVSGNGKFAINASASGSGAIDEVGKSGTSIPAYSSTPSLRNSTSSEIVASNKSKEGGSSTLLVVLIVVGTIVILVASAFLMLWRRRRSAAKYNAALYFGEDSYTKMGSEANQSGSSASKSVVLGELPSWVDSEMLSYRLRADYVIDARVIGTGSSTVVWLVSYRGGAHQFASKRLIDNGKLTTEHVTRFVDEIKLAASLSHPSIVQFFGVAWTTEFDLQALFEHMPNGDLRSYLNKTKPNAADWMPDKLRLALDIVDALVYTHSFDPPLVHRDLKSRNVLLDEDFKAKLCDFGCARLGSENDAMTSDDVGTGRWLAPEILNGSTSYDPSSDMYSFGVLLTELDTHTVPYANIKDTEGNLVSEAIILQGVAQGDLRPHVSSSCPLVVRQIARACLSFHPSHRPTAIQVAYKLRQALSPSST